MAQGGGPRNRTKLFQGGGLIIGKKTYLAMGGKTIDDVIAEVKRIHNTHSLVNKVRVLEKNYKQLTKINQY